MKYLIRIIDLINEWSGRAVMWLALILFATTAYETMQRYLFRMTSVALQESTWHLYSLLFLLGMAYTLKHDRHVRVDIFYDRMSDRQKAGVDLFAILVLILPFCLLMIGFSWKFMLTAYQIGERSGDPGGLSARWILKAAIPAGFSLLLLQGISEILKNLFVLFQDKKITPTPQKDVGEKGAA
ncbi:MAG: TRAP transporter small permease subunit [Deltaproteobacteria bacterium]|nr:TRAP transporter small permease subunit [Deltaproteobacteria bacterium]